MFQFNAALFAFCAKRYLKHMQKVRKSEIKVIFNKYEFLFSQIKMPRVAKTEKKTVNGGLNDKVTDNGIAEIKEELISKGRGGRTKRVTAALAEVKEEPIKKETVRGRRKVTTTAKETIENEELQEKKTGRKKALENGAEDTSIGSQNATKAIKNTKTTARKKQATPALDVMEDSEVNMAAITNEKAQTKRRLVKRSVNEDENVEEEEAELTSASKTAKSKKEVTTSSTIKTKGAAKQLETPLKEEIEITGKKSVKAAVKQVEAPLKEKIPIAEKKTVKAASKRGRAKKEIDIVESVEDVAAEEEKQQVLSTKAAAESPKKRAKIVKEETKTAAEPKKSRRVVSSKKISKIEESIENDEAYKEEQVKITKDAVVGAEKKSRGRKRALPAADVDVNDDANDDVDGSKPTKAKRAAPLNSTATGYNKADFELPGSGSEKRFNLKISSWNVAGLRAWLKKDGLKFLDYEEPDIFCLQETKCTTDQLPEEAARIANYHPYWLCKPGGYAGVAIYSKIMPINVEYGLGVDEFDDVGRLITAEYEKFYLINVYVPNSGRKLVNLEARMRWEKCFLAYVQQLDARKPVVMCGDMNVSHQEIDLANPKSNTRNAGFTKEERDKMTELLAQGYVDTFRHFYPQSKGAYTFWTYMGNARARNVGWRLDYFIVSERFIQRIVDNCIRAQCKGSDHCPITLFLKL